jgi:hypothetical protein
MPRRPIDLDAVRRAEAKLDQLLREHPELREANPERQQALEEWLRDNLKEQVPCPESPQADPTEDRQEADTSTPHGA